MTLDGIQTMLVNKSRLKNAENKSVNSLVNLVRYADDFIITGRTKEFLENEIMPLIEEFLSARGLILSKEKTKITHINDGFDFLGFNLRKYDGKLLIKPSKEKVKKFLNTIRETIDTNKACKQEKLIQFLNPKIAGWANYYKLCVATDVFNKADHQIFRKLWQWSKRRHPKKGTNWVKLKYFPKIGNRSWCFSSGYNNNGTTKHLSLRLLSDTKIIQLVKIRGDANPYDTEWKDYFEKRKTYKMLISLKGRKSLLYLWKKQKRRCPICGEPIDKEKTWYLTDKSVDGKTVKFLAHNWCHRRRNNFN